MPRHPLTPELVTHLTTLRTQALAARDTLATQGPDPDTDLLGAIAWRSALEDGLDPVLRDLINQARDQRITWTELAVACGDTEDRDGANRTQARQQWRNSR